MTSEMIIEIDNLLAALNAGEDISTVRRTYLNLLEKKPYFYLSNDYFEKLEFIKKQLQRRSERERDEQDKKELEQHKTRLEEQRMKELARRKERKWNSALREELKHKLELARLEEQQKKEQAQIEEQRKKEEERKKLLYGLKRSLKNDFLNTDRYYENYCSSQMSRQRSCFEEPYL